MGNDRTDGHERTHIHGRVCTILRCVLASDLTITLALIGIFGVLFPALAMGLIGFAVAQALGERAENQRRPNRWRRRAPGED